MKTDWQKKLEQSKQVKHTRKTHKDPQRENRKIDNGMKFQLKKMLKEIHKKNIRVIQKEDGIYLHKFDKKEPVVKKLDFENYYQAVESVWQWNN